MKKFILLLALVMTCSVLPAQDETNNSKSKTVELLEKDGVLLQKDFFDIGRVGGVSFQTIVITNLSSGEKTGALRVITEYSSSSYIGTLDFDELSGCISSMEYIKANILVNTYNNYMECEYKTRDGVEFGVYSKENPVARKERIWTFYLRTRNYTDRSFVSMKIDKLDDIIECLKKAQSNLSEHLK